MGSVSGRAVTALRVQSQEKTAGGGATFGHHTVTGPVA
jgi:hypothetical protein